MDGAVKLGLQETIDQSLAGQSLKAFEGGRLDRHDKMALAALPRAGMAGMAIRLIDNVETGGSEARIEGFAHRVGDFSHGFIKARRLCAVNS